jgi:YVTN family beta-propeller protein
MPELPSGTVTFLFTDIEGSTRLLTELRERYGELLADHHRLLRAAFADVGGQEIGTQGDSFFVAFRRAKDAISAAVAAQRSLAAHSWPDGVDVRVRMGIHTGEPSISEVGLVSLAVHRAARISAAGHGGQVLLSSTTRDLVEDELPNDVQLRDLGEHRLKDLDRSERIHELVVEGLSDEFPPLKTLESQPTREIPLEELGSAVRAGRVMRRPSRRALLLAGLGAALAAVSILALALARGDSGGGLTVRGNAVGIIDPVSNSVVGEIPVGQRPGPLDFGAGALWVANLDDETVSRIDPGRRTIAGNIPIGAALTDLAAGASAVWALSTSPAPKLAQIDPRFDNVAGTIEIRSLPGGSGGVAVRGGDVWAAPAFGLLSRIDSRTGRIVATAEAGGSPTRIAVSRDAVWIADADAGAVMRIDATNLVTTIPVGRRPSAIAVGEGAVWVAASLDDSVARIDPDRGAAIATISVGRAPSGVAVGAGAVWVANSGDGTVSRIDPKRNEVVATIDVGGSPSDIAVGAGTVWVSVQAAVLAEGGSPVRAGGVARINAEDDVGSMDPALAPDPLSWQLGYATCAKLLNYPDKPAPEGSRLAPEVAQSLPARSADGRTYTFTIRRGFRFSPPSNEAVTAATFKYAIERSLHPRMNGPAQQYGGDIVGAGAFIAGRAKHVSGLVVRGNKLMVTLVAPAPDFLARITLPYFCAVPVGTPVDPRGIREVPSAGPYYVAAYTPGQGIVMKRNPSYRGARPHRLLEIRLTVGVDRAASVEQIEAGTADWAADGIPPDAVDRLSERYGRGRAATGGGRQRYFRNPILGVDGIFGFRDARIYPFVPDLAKARELAGGRSGTAVLYTCNVSPCRQLAEIVKGNLRPIGIDVEIHEFPPEVLEAKLEQGAEVDIVMATEFGTYQDPSTFLAFLARFDPRYRRKVEAVARLAGPKRYLAYADLDAELARNDAPFAAFANPTAHDFFSARMGCQVFQPVYGIDLAALCIRR